MPTEEDVYRIRNEVEGLPKLDAEAKALEGVGLAADKAAKGTAGFGQSALQAGRVIQDFTQGGLGGILNNLEGVAAALGGGPGLAGVLTLAGVAAFLFKDRLKELGEVLGGGGGARWGLAGGLEDLKEQLAGAQKQLKELGDAAGLSGGQLETLHALRVRIAATEKTIADEMERQARAKKLLELKDVTEEAAAKERAGRLSESLGGDQAAMIAAVQAGLPTTRLDQLRAQREAAIARRHGLIEAGQMTEAGFLTTRELPQLQHQIDAELVRLRQEATDLVSRAVVGGERGAFGQIRGMMGRRPGGFTAEQKAAFENASPESLAQDRENEASLERVQEAARARKQQARERNREFAEVQRQQEQVERQEQHDVQQQQARESAEARGRARATAANLGRTALGGEAEQYAAQLRQSGADPEVQTARLTRAIRERLHGMPGATTAAQEMARQAFSAVDAAMQQQHVLGQVVGNQAALEARTRQLSATARRNSQDAAAVGRAINSQTNLNVGW